MIIPSDAEILDLLDRLDKSTAEDLESQWLEFKPWTDPKADMRVATEYAVCLANAEGGVIVFGVSDQTRGRAAAIHGAGRFDADLWVKSIYDSTRPNLKVELTELPVPEGTGRVLVIRVPKGEDAPYGTSRGLFQARVGKNCMPLDSHAFLRTRVASGAMDWSGQPVKDVSLADLDPVEIDRARGILGRVSPDSPLLKLDKDRLLAALGVVRDGKVTHAGLLLLGREDVLSSRCPQHQVHYVYQTSGSAVARNDGFRVGLLQILERIEQAFTGPANPEEELTVGLFKLRIPAFPIEAVREAVLNAVTHRDYLDPDEVLIRHAKHELAVTSPGGFVAGITIGNILRHEPVSRNRTLAETFQKLRLVERAGVGRHRIFESMLRYGKRIPVYEADGSRVTLRLFNGAFDARMANLVAKWARDGREIDLDVLLVLTRLREHAFIDTESGSELLQLPKDDVRAVLDRLAQPGTGILERRGGSRTSTFHLAKGVARDLLGKAAYTKTKGLNPIRYAELVKSYLADHESITPQECRELLGLGESQTARVEISRYLRKWSGKDGFLVREGSPPKFRYRLRP